MPEPTGPYDSLDPSEPGPEPGPEPEARRGSGAYESLDPDPPTPKRERSDSAGATRALLRGLVKRCPRCGARGIFDGWFRIKERCPRCGLRFQREEGGFLGAMTINYAVAMLAWVPVLVVGFAVTSPDPPVLKLTLLSAAILTVIPLLFYPNSKSIWAAVEYLVSETEPLEPDPREPFPSEDDPGGGRF